MDARVPGADRSLRGRPVVTADRKRIGSIEEVRDEAVKVRAGILQSFWLSTDSVCAVRDDEIKVSFSRNELPWHTIASPRA